MQRRKRKAKLYSTAEEVPMIGAWIVTERGDFYRPVKNQITLRLDKDVIAWFKAGGEGYQTRINEVLRDFVRAQLTKESKT